MTTFYGACNKCGAGYWADVEPGPGGQMLGPHVVVVCQQHLPVGEADLLNEGTMASSDRKAWQEWRKQAEAEQAVTKGDEAK